MNDTFMCPDCQGRGYQWRSDLIENPQHHREIPLRIEILCMRCWGEGLLKKPNKKEEDFNRDDWIWSIMTTSKLTHLHRVMAWHIFKMADLSGFAPYSISEMARKVGYVHRSQVQRAITSLKRLGYVIDFGPEKPFKAGNRTGNKDRSKRFKLTLPEEKTNGAVRQGRLAQVHHEHQETDASSPGHSLASSTNGRRGLVHSVLDDGDGQEDRFYGGQIPYL